ncbi:hypothetical protein J22TS1_39540 [Siminovitchia terrae]|nr:hypothetical protein J22TS1_39540 [Siminovitchia terrae]
MKWRIKMRGVYFDCTAKLFNSYLWIRSFFDCLKVMIENPIRNAIITIFYNI